VIEYLNSVRGLAARGRQPGHWTGCDRCGLGLRIRPRRRDGQHSLADLRSFQDWHLRYASNRSRRGRSRACRRVREGVPGGTWIPTSSRPTAFRFPTWWTKSAGPTATWAGRYSRSPPLSITSGARLHQEPRRHREHPAQGGPRHARLCEKRGPGPPRSDLRRGVAELDGKGETWRHRRDRYGENALSVIDGIKRKLKEIGPSLPPGVRIVPTYDRSELIDAAIATLREKLIEESIVVAFVCLIFLWHVRSALVAVITLPIAILLSFIPHARTGADSNIMSLAASRSPSAPWSTRRSSWLRTRTSSSIISGRQRTGTGQRGANCSHHRRSPQRRPSALLLAAGHHGELRAVFSLTRQEGRLFKPLAFTKTFAMGFAPCWASPSSPSDAALVRGKITPEGRNPVNRFLIWAYRPFADFVLRFRWLTLWPRQSSSGYIYPVPPAGQGVHAAAQRGTILFMPTAVPGMSIGKATRILQIQDRLLKQIRRLRLYWKGGPGRDADRSRPPFYVLRRLWR